MKPVPSTTPGDWAWEFREACREQTRAIIRALDGPVGAELARQNGVEILDELKTLAREQLEKQREPQ